MAGLILSCFWASYSDSIRAKGTATVFWWIIFGVLTGIVEALSASAAIPGPQNQVGPGMAAGIRMLMGSAFLGSIGAAVGGIIGLCYYFHDRNQT